MPDDTHELITAAQFAHWLAIAAFAVLVGGIAVGIAWGSRHGAPRAGFSRGFASGLTGPAALLLWRIYNLIEDRYGLDSVRALLTNLALFVAAGVVAGLLLRWVWRRTEMGNGENAAAPAVAPAPVEEMGGV